MQRFHALTGNLPPRRSAWRAPALADDVPSQAFAQQLERVRAAPKIPEWERIFQEMQLDRRARRAAHAERRGGDARSSMPGSIALLEKRRWLRARASAAARAMRRPSVVGWALAAPALRRHRACSSSLPVLAGLALSLTDFDLYALADLSHAALRRPATTTCSLLQTPLFWQALGNTLYFVVVGVPVSIGLSLGAALLLHARVARFQPFFRTALFAPVVTTVVAVAVIWRYLLHTRYGLDQPGRSAAIGIDPIDWLGDPHWSMPAIILFAAWKNFGYNMIILLAALQAVPREMYESARVDGAAAVAPVRRPHLADAARRRS